MSNPDTTRIFNYPEVTTPASDAKILLDSQTVGSKCIDANLFRCDLIDKTITQRGTFEASEDDADGFKKVVVDIPYTDVHVASGPIATFEGEDLPLKSLTASIVPVQDLHGYDSPWAGGAGKNKLPLTVDLLKSVNGGANTWNNNSKEINGITYTIQVDDNGNVIGINANGTATSNSIIYLMGASSPQIELSGQSVIISLSGFSKGAYKDNSWHDILSTSTESTVTLNGAVSQVWGQINNGVTVNNIVLKPMIRLASVTDATFAPYSNICPISGWDEEVITVTDDLQNPTVTHTTTIPFTDSQGNPVEVYGGSVDVVNGGENPSILKKIDLGSLSWVYDARFNGFRASNTSYKKFSGVVPNGCCEIYKMVSNSYFLTNNPNNAISFGVVGGYDNNILIRDTRYTDATEFKTAVTGKYLCYELATPTTFYTQPTSIKSLDGENNVFASTGDVEELKYFTRATS